MKAEQRAPAVQEASCAYNLVYQRVLIPPLAGRGQVLELPLPKTRKDYPLDSERNLKESK